MSYTSERILKSGCYEITTTVMDKYGVIRTRSWISNSRSRARSSMLKWLKDI